MTDLSRSIEYIGIFNIHFSEDTLKIIDNIVKQFDLTNIEDKHITLCHSKNKTHSSFISSLEKENTEIEITVKFLALSNDYKILCAAVELPENIECFNEYPHITIALKKEKGISAYMSNAVLESKNYDVMHELDEKITGTIQLKLNPTKKKK